MEKNVLTKPMRQRILDQTIMIMDGNLLTAFWEKGSCIPDKLIEQREVISELTDEIFNLMNIKDKERQVNLLELIRNHRRGSNVSTCNHKKVNKQKQRHSWGPDDTWSKQFVDTTQFVNKNNVKSKNTSKSKKRSESVRTNTESNLTLSACQPLNRYQDRSKQPDNKNITNDLNNNINISECQYKVCDKQMKQKHKELKKLISWLSDESYDYVHSEQAQNLSDVEIFLDVMKSSRIPVQMKLEVNSPTDINLTYQFLPKFKDEFMILNISKTHCMVMRAF